jgi:hypothetical protein
VGCGGADDDFRIGSLATGKGTAVISGGKITTAADFVVCNNGSGVGTINGNARIAVGDDLAVALARIFHQGKMHSSG